MIVNKGNDANMTATDAVGDVEVVQTNALINVFKAVKRILLSLHEDKNDAGSPALFKAVMIDNGQFDRILREENVETEIAFPAVFIHFINVRYLVQQQRIGEGRATMRVRFILNRLNTEDPDVETEPFSVFERINVAIQDGKSTEPALNERCNLIYFDMPQSTGLLQGYWVDYEIWFREDSAFEYRNWVKRYVVMPPFTDHRDATWPEAPGHGDHGEPGYDEVSGMTLPKDSEGG